MALSVTTFASRMNSAAANVATQMGSGTTQAEVEGMAAVLTALSNRQELMNHLIKLANTTAVTPA